MCASTSSAFPLLGGQLNGAGQGFASCRGPVPARSGGDLWEAAEPGSAERLPRFPVPLPSPQVCLLQWVKRGGGHCAPVLTMLSQPCLLPLPPKSHLLIQQAPLMVPPPASFPSCPKFPSSCCLCRHLLQPSPSLLSPSLLLTLFILLADRSCLQRRIVLPRRGL